jgi:hypothetical protein
MTACATLPHGMSMLGAVLAEVGALYATYVAGRRVGRDWPERVVDAWLEQNGA